MRAFLAAISLALVVSGAFVSDAQARHRYHHSDLQSQKLRSQIGAMSSQLDDLKREIASLRDVWAAAPKPNGPFQNAVAPDWKDTIPEIITGDAGADFPPVRLVSLPPATAPLDERSPADDLAEARAYLCETAHPGGTMTRLGCRDAIGFLHPEFAKHLATAVREARSDGLLSAGVYSAYRPPGFGVGGFRNKYRSLHSYGLAVDMHGVGRPCSATTRQWRKIAARNGVAMPYGSCNGAEWNHAQATRVKVAPSSMRKTITAKGPIDLGGMWDAAANILTTVGGLIPNLFADRTRVRHRHFARHYHHRRHHRRA